MGEEDACVSLHFCSNPVVSNRSFCQSNWPSIVPGTDEHDEYDDHDDQHVKPDDEHKPNDESEHDDGKYDDPDRSNEHIGSKLRHRDGRLRLGTCPTRSVSSGFP